MTDTLYAPKTPATAISAAVLTAAREWGTEAVTHNATAYNDADTTAAVWVFEIVGVHPNGYNLFGREALAVVDLATMAVTLTDGE